MHNPRVASPICILLYLGAFRRDSSHSGLVTGIARIPRTKVVTSLRPRIQLRVFPFFPLYGVSLRPFTFTHSRVVRWSVPTSLYVHILCGYRFTGILGSLGFWKSKPSLRKRDSFDFESSPGAWTFCNFECFGECPVSRIFKSYYTILRIHNLKDDRTGNAQGRKNICFLGTWTF